jgi:hypothetical protein
VAPGGLWGIFHRQTPSACCISGAPLHSLRFVWSKTMQGLLQPWLILPFTLVTTEMVLLSIKAAQLPHF